MPEQLYSSPEELPKITAETIRNFSDFVSGAYKLYDSTAGISREDVEDRLSQEAYARIHKAAEMGDQATQDLLRMALAGLLDPKSPQPTGLIGEVMDGEHVSKPVQATIEGINFQRARMYYEIANDEEDQLARRAKQEASDEVEDYNDAVKIRKTADFQRSEGDRDSFQDMRIMLANPHLELSLYDSAIGLAYSAGIMIPNIPQDDLRSGAFSSVDLLAQMQQQSDRVD